MRTETFMVEGYQATVHIPDNATGEWLWKTEFFYAFDEVERGVFDKGYTRAYFAICDKYGSPDAVRLMYAFYKEMCARFDVNPKVHLVGFSRGGLYAFNFALAHPECVASLYLDAPVLDLRSWPRTDPAFNEMELHEQVMTEYGFASEEEFLTYSGYPVGQLEVYFALGIPTLLVAGDADSIVTFEDNSLVMIDYATAHGHPLTWCVKCDVEHHPHGFGCNEGINFKGEPYPKEMRLYGTLLPGTDKDNPATCPNQAELLTGYWDTL